MSDEIKTAYHFSVSDTTTKKILSWHKTRDDAVKALARWARRCERRGVKSNAVVSDALNP